MYERLNEMSMRPIDRLRREVRMVGRVDAGWMERMMGRRVYIGEMWGSETTRGMITVT